MLCTPASCCGWPWKPVTPRPGSTSGRKLSVSMTRWPAGISGRLSPPSQPDVRRGVYCPSWGGWSAMIRVLVAGATGYLGRFVARESKDRGAWVRVLARNLARLKTPGPFLEPAIAGLVDDVFVGEVTQPETLRGL